MSVQISASKMTSIDTRQEQMKFQIGDKTMEGATQEPSEEKANHKCTKASTLHSEYLTIALYTLSLP